MKQQQVRDTSEPADGDDATKLLSIMPEYAVQRRSLREPTGKDYHSVPVKARNPDTRDSGAAEFLASTGADIREAAGETPRS